MCGRTALTLSDKQLRCACSYKQKDSDTYTQPDWLPEHNAGKEYVPSYNIAPTDVTPVLVSSYKFKNSATTDRILKPMMWGTIPPWHKGDFKTHKLSTNNCRLENVRSSKLFGSILKNGGRCVILVEGFYEWQTTAVTKTKQPYYIYPPEECSNAEIKYETDENEHKQENRKRNCLLHMAGLYNIWQENETIIYSYSVITMESNDTLNWLHHRMPAVLDTEEQIEAWLDIEHVNENMALSYLKPTKLLSYHKVSTTVNNSQNKSQNCNKRLELQSDKKNVTQKTLNTWLKVEKRKQENLTKEDFKKFKK